MKVYKEKNWGADADGNRGISITEYEIDDSDYDSIYDQVMQLKDELSEDGEELPSTMTITLICPYTEEDIEFEIDPKDYL